MASESELVVPNRVDIGASVVVTSGAAVGSKVVEVWSTPPVVEVASVVSALGPTLFEEVQELTVSVVPRASAVEVEAW